MAITMRYRRSCSIALAGACLWTAAAVQGAAAGEDAPRADDPVQRIERMLADAELAERIEAWGISVAEIRADVRSLSEAERRTLAALLEKGWSGVDAEQEPAVTAQYLVMIAMMRESNLFTSVISNWLGNPP